MPNFRKLAPSAYLVALALIFIPFFDASMSVWPWSPGNSQWRFGALGILCNALMIPSAGMFMAVAAAVLAEQPRAKVWLGRAAWVVAIVSVLSIVVFALDAVQMGPKLVPNMITSYKVAVLTAVVKLFVGGVTFALMGLACGVPSPKVPKATKSR